MRDDRLRWTIFDEHRRKASYEGRALLTGLDTPAFDAAIARWWKREGVRAVANDLNIRQHAGTDLAATLPAADATIAPAIARAVAGSQDEGAADVAAREILGTGIAALVVHGGFDSAAFDSAAEFVHGSADIESFASTCARALVGPERDLWIATLSSVPNDVGECLHRGRAFGTNPEVIATGEKRDRARGATQYLWGRISDRELAMLRPQLTVRLATLHALSPTAFFGALERLPGRALREWMLRVLHLTQDRDLILEGLRMARSVYGSGAWNGNSVAALFARGVVAHAAELSGSLATELRMCADAAKIADMKARFTALTANEIPEWLRSAFKVLLERTDGMWLATSLGAQLVDESARPSNAEWSATRMAVEALAGCLAQSAHAREGGTWPWREVAAADGALSGARPSAGDYLAFAAFVEHEARATTPPASRSGIAWTWYNELLLARDDALCSHVNPHGSTPNFIYSIIGTALAVQADAVGAWATAWDALWPQRNQQRFRLPEFDALYPSAHILQVAAAADLQLSTKVARELWTRLWRAAAQFVRGSSYRPLVPDHALRALAAVVPAIFGADLAEPLTVAGPLLETDSDLILMAAAMMLLNKASYESVTKSMEAVGCDVSKAMASVRWFAGQLGTEISESTQQCIRIIEDAAKTASVSASKADGAEKKPR